MDTSVITVGLVLAFMSHIPAREARSGPPGGFEKTGDSHRVAEGIVQAVQGDKGDPLLGRLDKEAALMAIFAAYEGGNRSNAVGDGGRSFGVFQLQLKGISWEVAVDPIRAAPVWLDWAHRTEERCQNNAPEERLAALASGDCGLGRRLVRRRVELAEAIVEAVQAE